MALTTLLTTIKELVPGTSEYETLQKSRSLALEVIHEWDSLDTVYFQIQSRLNDNRDFYLGENRQMFSSSTHEGEMKIPVNVGATVIDLIVFLLANSMPTVQFVPESANKLDQVEASICEDLVKNAFKDAKFHKKFRDTCKMMVGFAGFAWWYPFWNKTTKFGQKSNHFDFTLLNPYTTRVKYEGSDYEQVEYFITSTRMTPAAIYQKYDGFEAGPDSENPWLPKAFYETSDGMTTVFRKYDAKNVTVVIDNRVADQFQHGFDFAPIIQTNNVWVLNDAHGHDEVERWRPIAQELNTLITAASEIARDLAWPPLLEYNKALGGKKITKWRGQKIPVRRTAERGEGIEFLLNPAQIEPILRQIELLLNLFHFISLMPKAAAGIFEASVTSGFQAKLAMQPATLAAENKKIDLESSIVELARCALWLIQENDPGSLKVALEDGTQAELKDLWQNKMEVVWPDNLPIDIAREIQNLILGIQNSLTSVTQAIDKYNVLMGMSSPEDTLDYLRQEAKEAEINPDRALKVAKVQEALANIKTALGAIREKVNLGGLPEQMENPTNMARAAASPLPEEKRPTPQTAKEATVPESTGGVLPEEI